MMILQNNQSNTLRSNTHSVVRSVVVIGAILACSSSYQTVMAADDLCKTNGVGMSCTAGTLHQHIACCVSSTTSALFYCKYHVQYTLYNYSSYFHRINILIIILVRFLLLCLFSIEACCTAEFTTGNPTQTIQMVGTDVTCGLGLNGNSQLCEYKKDPLTGITSGIATEQQANLPAQTLDPAWCARKTPGATCGTDHPHEGQCVNPSESGPFPVCCPCATVQNGRVVGAGTNGVGDTCTPGAVAANGEVSMGVNPNAFEGCTNPMELLGLTKSNEDDASSVDDADVVTTAATSTNASGASSFLASVAVVVSATATIVVTIAGTIML